MEKLTEQEKTILDMADKIRKEKLGGANFQDTSGYHAITNSPAETTPVNPQSVSNSQPANPHPNHVRLQPNERAERRFCQNCNDSLMHVERKTSHILHAIFSVITAGLWLIGWLAVHMYNQSKGSRCIRCGTVQMGL